MNKQNIIELILESLPKSIVATDKAHVITYMKKAARDEHTNLAGKSLFDCHNKDSVREIKLMQGVWKQVRTKSS